MFNEVVKKTVTEKIDTLHQSLRIIDIAKERDFSIEELLSYEISSCNMLFNENGLITKEPKKSAMTHHLEKPLHSEDYTIPDRLIMSIIVDVIFYCHKILWSSLKKFGDFGKAFCNVIKSNCKGITVERIDFVFDDYFELSPKSSERIRRAKSDFIDAFDIHSETLVPSQADKFWASDKNKESLQIFLRNYILLQSTEVWPGVELVFSTIKSLECISTNSHLKKDPSMSSLQSFDIEEADVKIMLHINDCSIEGKKNILVLSADTDVVVMILNFWNTFLSNGLQVRLILYSKHNPIIRRKLIIIVFDYYIFQQM